MTEGTQVARYRYKRVEALLCLSLVFLKLNVLYRQWGKPTGYDWFNWLPVLHYTRWFETLPSTRSVGISYHPPLAYLLARLIHYAYPHEVEASQILSTLATLAAFFALRAWIRRVGWLYTLPGFWLLYGGMSIPLLVYLAVETSYDALVVTWFTMILAASMALFWNGTRPRWWTDFKFSAGLTGLGILFACAMMTKVNGLFSFALPFIIILVRRGQRGLRREFRAPLVAAAIGLTIIGPFYYHHYYKTEGHWIVMDVEWLRKQDLDIQRARRDRAPVYFVRRMLMWPIYKNPDPQTADWQSFPHLVWTETWIKDSWLGKQPEPSLSVSVGYAKTFAWILPAGTAFFLLRRRRIPRDWRDVGWVLLSVAVMFSLALLYFGYKYPLWDWRVFKAKYLSPAIFWIPYATGVLFSEKWFRNPKCRVFRWMEQASFLTLVAFMFVNHLLPVY